MAALDWSQCPAVESIPGKVSGAWVFRGTRLFPVSAIFENLKTSSVEEVLENSSRDARADSNGARLRGEKHAAARNVARRMKIILDESVPQTAVASVW